MTHTATRTLVALAALVAAGCSSTASPAPGPDTPVGCGMVDARDLAGLLGPDLTSTTGGGLARLRTEGRPASCRTVASGEPARFVAVGVVRHPSPMRLPPLDCNGGWVYAGTPDKYAPACQHSRGGRSTTVLLARWEKYVVRVTVGRTDRDWAGDPEIALRLSEQVATRLGVPVPGQSASGSSS